MAGALCPAPWSPPTELLIFQGSLCGLSSSWVVGLLTRQLASEGTQAETARPLLTLGPRTGTASLLPILLVKEVKDPPDSMGGGGTTEGLACWVAWFLEVVFGDSYQSGRMEMSVENVFPNEGWMK